MAKKKKKRESTKKRRSYQRMLVDKNGRTHFDRAEPVDLPTRVYRRYPEIQPWRKGMPIPGVSGKIPFSKVQEPMYIVREDLKIRELEEGVVSDKVLTCLKATSPDEAIRAIYFDHTKDCDWEIFWLRIQPDIVWRLLPVLSLLKFEYPISEQNRFFERHPLVQEASDIHRGLLGAWVTKSDNKFGTRRIRLNVRHKELFRQSIEFDRNFGFYSIDQFLSAIDQIGHWVRSESDNPVKMPKVEIKDRSISELIDWRKKRAQAIEDNISNPKIVHDKFSPLHLKLQWLEEIRQEISRLEAIERSWTNPEQKELPEGFGLTVLR